MIVNAPTSSVNHWFDEIRVHCCKERAGTFSPTFQFKINIILCTLFYMYFLPHNSYTSRNGSCWRTWLIFTGATFLMYTITYTVYTSFYVDRIPVHHLHKTIGFDHGQGSSWHNAHHLVPRYSGQQHQLACSRSHFLVAIMHSACGKRKSQKVTVI